MLNGRAFARRSLSVKRADVRAQAEIAGEAPGRMKSNQMQRADPYTAVDFCGSKQLEVCCSGKPHPDM